MISANSAASTLFVLISCLFSKWFVSLCPVWVYIRPPCTLYKSVVFSSTFDAAPLDGCLLYLFVSFHSSGIIGRGLCPLPLFTCVKLCVCSYFGVKAFEVFVHIVRCFFAAAELRSHAWYACVADFSKHCSGVDSHLREKVDNKRFFHFFASVLSVPHLLDCLFFCLTMQRYNIFLMLANFQVKKMQKKCILLCFLTKCTMFLTNYPAKYSIKESSPE